MKKSLNENIRIEFREILEDQEYQDLIKAKKLDPKIIEGALEKLLKTKAEGSNLIDEVDSTRADFENYIINTLKTRQHSL